MTLVRFQAVSKRYPGVPTPAVADLNLDCADGEMLALLGPSGCGKSSTLKMAAGLEALSAGEIFFDDEPVSRLAPGARNIAMVFEDYGLYPRMTVRENIAFPLVARGMARAEAVVRVDDALALLDLGDMADRPVQGLSGGAMQRISIGRALVRDPRLILFDEPLSHLDGDQRVTLRTEIKRLQKTRGVTSILVTHDQTEATAMADRIAVMHHGVLQQVDTPAALYERPANVFVANFIGEPPMNMLPGRVEGEGGAVRIAALGRAFPLDPRRARLLAGRSGELTVGVRPEHVAIEPEGEGRPADATVSYRESRGDADSLILSPFAAPDVAIRVEVPGPAAFRPGDRVAVVLAPERLHLFDRASERNVEAAS
ncbi:ABC transporter ATP-binding protein [uncultured Methylobacterium sp.]|uniref:ABC transporter ATP-binding protein n=1 Tax=uncultured Methylobacterium sp. TaxID=157278 RepID=UPI0035C949FD